MFLKNNVRPAYAVAGNANIDTRKHQTDAAMFAAGSEADDVNAFGFGSSANKGNSPRGDMPPRKNTPPRGKMPPRRRSFWSSFKKDNRTMFIGIAAAAAAVLVLLLIIIGIATADKSIKMENNAFLAFEKDGTYSVSVNGHVIEEAFEGEVTIRPAADHSFAYVVEESADGFRVFLLKGKKLEPITATPVSKVLAYADYKPGLVYETDDATNNVDFYSEKHGTGRVMYNEPTGYDTDGLHFLISGDASTIVFTRPNKNDPSKKDVCLFRADEETQTIVSAPSITPVALSIDGSYLYVSAYNGATANSLKLYYYDTTVDTTEDSYKHTLVGTDGNFGGIISMNVSGEEVVYYTTDGTTTATYVYSMKRKNKGDDLNPSIKIGDGKLEPVFPEKEIACPETFKKCYFEGPGNPFATEDTENQAYKTCYLNKKYEPTEIASAKGQFTDDGEYFYYINKDGNLWQAELDGKTFTKTQVIKNIVITDFAVTAKGNIYYLTDEQVLNYRKMSAKKNTPIMYGVQDISLMESGNTVYIVDKNSENIYTSKEGSEPEVAKFSGEQLTSLPIFINSRIKRCYAIVSDATNGYSVYYTSNGKSFKHIDSACSDIITVKRSATINNDFLEEE